MKKLFFALICTAFGFTASANNSLPKNQTTTSTKLETVIGSRSVNTIENGNLTTEQLGLFRRQMNFVFTDACGKATRVYVSGASAASDHELWWFAWRWFVDATIDANHGCL